MLDSTYYTNLVQGANGALIDFGKQLFSLSLEGAICASRTAVAIYEASDVSLDKHANAFKAGVKHGLKHQEKNGREINLLTGGIDQDLSVANNASISDASYQVLSQYLLDPYRKMRDSSSKRLEFISENPLSTCLLESQPPKEILKNLLDKIMLDSGTAMSAACIGINSNIDAVHHILNAAAARFLFTAGECVGENLPMGENPLISGMLSFADGIESFITTVKSSTGFVSPMTAIGDEYLPLALIGFLESISRESGLLKDNHEEVHDLMQLVSGIGKDIWKAYELEKGSFEKKDNRIKDADGNILEATVGNNPMWHSMIRKYSDRQGLLKKSEFVSDKCNLICSWLGIESNLTKDDFLKVIDSFSATKAAFSAVAGKQIYEMGTACGELFVDALKVSYKEINKPSFGEKIMKEREDNQAKSIGYRS